VQGTTAYKKRSDATEHREQRFGGALADKYPLTMNALVAAD